MDNNNKHEAPSLTHSFGRLILQLRKLERQPRTFEGIGPLTPSEMHTIDAIGPEGSVLMSELAARLGITKGAVTQLIARLESKTLVVRSMHPTDHRSTLISLTVQGKAAYTMHEELHQAFYNQLQTQMSPEEIAVFAKTIDKFIFALDH
ncbi:MarR family winged helix-turn-helix transcriptional regulator [Paenibacillus gorillae]|uniref:MarR family winged helix-turn-helix transcriptional regulator n=1 Tax=Paenibacillus gorillae TaxID=1243662 RepID=UPI0004B8AC06|nr:MarR family transcriptional regulator [Paenibacillus gorillae]